MGLLNTVFSLSIGITSVYTSTSLQHGHVLAPKLIILLYVYNKQPHYNTVSLITRSASMDPKDSIIMRLYCTYCIAILIATNSPSTDTDTDTEYLFHVVYMKHDI